MPYHSTTLGGGGQPTPRRLGLWDLLHTRACRGVVRLALRGQSTMDIAQVATRSISSSVALSYCFPSPHCLSDSLDRDPSRGYEKHVSARLHQVGFSSIPRDYALTRYFHSTFLPSPHCCSVTISLTLYDGIHITPPHPRSHNVFSLNSWGDADGVCPCGSARFLRVRPSVRPCQALTTDTSRDVRTMG